MAIKEAKTSSYTISKVRSAGDANQYFITIERDGQTVGDVKVMSSPRSGGYYNEDSDRPAIRKKEKVA